MRKNLGEHYSPLYFLAALGNGGMTVAFFLLLMFMVKHPETPIPTFEHVSAAFNSGNIALSALIIFATIGILFFAINHFRLLLWNIREYRGFKQTGAYEKLKNSAAAVQLMAIPLTIGMSVNVLFILGGVYVPGLWNVVEYLFPGALAGFTIIGIYALRIFTDYFSRFVIHGSLNTINNNHLSQLLAVFAFSMIGVGYSSSAAMSHETVTSTIGLVGAIFFGSIAVILAVVKMVVGFQSILKQGIDKAASPSIWIIIPILTILGITFVRLYMGVNHNLLHVKDPSVVPIFLVLTGLLSVQIIFGLFGYKVLKSIGYFSEFVDIKGSGKSPGSYSLICPGVAFTVMGMFFVHYGFVRTGIIEQFSTVYFLLLAPFWYVQLKTITTIFALNKKLLKSQEPQAVLKEVKSL
ncbi:TsoY family (seleno)protein [Calidifontibacillus erzurumensis]|uniref:TsoY family (seleno)protein n=1 Tax=Calidifontibacillus erzurumensis TaxID=2741433 RepID=UPI0035B542A8